MNSLALKENNNIAHILKYVSEINNHNKLDIRKYSYDDYIVFKIPKALVLYVDYENNILFEKSIERCNLNKKDKENIGQNSDIISDYITLLEKLERKTKIEKILKV